MIALRPKTAGKHQLKCEAQETQYAALIVEDGRAGVWGRREIPHGGGEGDGCVVGFGKRLSELGRENAKNIRAPRARNGAHTIFFSLAPFFPPWSALRRTFGLQVFDCWYALKHGVLLVRCGFKW